MKIGLLLHAERGIDFVYEEARQADLQGYDSVWLGDHLLPGPGSWADPNGRSGPLEALTMMTAIGAITRRTRLAWSVLNPGFRNPAVLAKSLATLDQITKGRVICSIGAGSNPSEYVAYNIPVFEHDARVEYMREVVTLLKQLWSHPAPEVTNFNGKHVAVKDLRFNPEPYQKPHIPIWIGGESDPTVQVMKDLADGWVTLSRSAAKAQPAGHAQRRLLDTGDRIREVMGAPDWPKRPMDIVLQIRIFVAESHEAALADAKNTLGDLYGSMDSFINREIVGTPDACIERIADIAKTGVNYLRLTFRDLSQQERVARLLLPRLQEDSSPLYRNSRR